MPSPDKTDESTAVAHAARTPQATEALSGPQGLRTPLPRRETHNSTRSRGSGPHSPQDEAPAADAPVADPKTAREEVARLLWWSVPGSTDEEAKTRTRQLLDEHAAEVRAAVLREGADAILRSFHGEPMRDAYRAKMQDVGLLRHMAAGCTTEPPTPAETATEYGIRIPGGRLILDGNTKHRAEQVERLARCRGKAMWPDAVLVQRTVAYGEWTEVQA